LTVPYNTPGPSPATVAATNLFPFPSAYTVYAGTCDTSSPAKNGLTDPGATITPGASGVAYTQQIPALNVTATENGAAPGAGRVMRVKYTLDPSAAGGAMSGCPAFSIVRDATAGIGVVADPGLPFGVYDVCVDDSLFNAGNPHKNVTTWQNVDVTGAAALPGPSKTINVPTGTGSTSGSC
jgi:hypothetical protein